jgi:organic hydroperoxide reductase OsmC/OhrA
MSEYYSTVRWNRGDAAFTDLKYSRVHEWSFDGGIRVPASASLHNVNPRYGSAEAVDPEEAFVVALSSCHMLWFLFFAAKRGVLVDSYEDESVGVMEKNAAGKLAVTRVRLRPKTQPPIDRGVLEELHHQAHEECFLANSVKTEIVVELD